MDSVFEVALGPSARGRRVALLRELTGFDELGTEGTHPVAATALIERLLVEAPGALGPTELSTLPLGERDRLVAALHARHFGDRVESVVCCSACGKAFAIDFSLQALLASLSEGTPGERPAGPDEGGFYAFEDGRSFRLPHTGDERAVRGLSTAAAADELLRRCSAGAASTENASWLPAAMAVVGPVIDLELPARCSLCRREQAVHFDIVSFFLVSLARERSLLLREVHRLAAAYHWGRNEILGLSRSERRVYVTLVESERGRSRAKS